MKKIILIFVLLFSVTSVVLSQEKIESLSSVTVQSDTLHSECTYDFYYTGSKYYDGVVGYQFSVTDTITRVALEARYPTGSYVLISSMDTVTAGTYGLYATNPIYQQYRVSYYGASGDTSTVSGIIYFEKLPIKK